MYPKPESQLILKTIILRIFVSNCVLIWYARFLEWSSQKLYYIKHWTTDKLEYIEIVILAVSKEEYLGVDLKIES